MMKHVAVAIALLLCACGGAAEAPVSISSPKLDSGVRGNGGGGLGGESVVGKSTGGAGVVNRITVP